MADTRAQSIAAPGASSDDQRELWQLDLDTAMRRRWDEGRARYGEAWRGRHPLVEAHEELVDALVYLGLAQAPYSTRLALQATTERVARSIRAMRPTDLKRWTLGSPSSGSNA
jgi:hypothetical protein